MGILVTGATGFIGRRLVQKLAEAGQAVTILIREQYSAGLALPGELAALRPHLHIVYADLRNFRLTSRAIHDAAPKAVYHLAAAGVTDPFLGVETALRHNVTGTLNLLRASFDSPGKPSPERIIISRTPGERSAMNVYAASKAAAWNFCQMYARTQSWPIFGAMVFQTYGPGQPQHTLIPSALAAARAGDTFPMTSGVQERDWIYVDDVADGLLAMLQADLTQGQTIELGTGRLTPVADVVRQIFALVDGPGRPLVGALPDRPGEERRQPANVAPNQQLIGWQATTALIDGLEKTNRQWSR